LTSKINNPNLIIFLDEVAVLLANAYVQNRSSIRQAPCESNSVDHNLIMEKVDEKEEI